MNASRAVFLSAVLEDYDTVAKALPPQMDHAAGCVTAAVLVLAARVDELVQSAEITGDTIAQLKEELANIPNAIRQGQAS